MIGDLSQHHQHKAANTINTKLPTAILARRLELTNQIASHIGQEDALPVTDFSSLCKQALYQIRENCKSIATQTDRLPSISSTTRQLQQRDILRIFFFSKTACLPIMPTSQKCAEFSFLSLLLLRSSWHVSEKENFFDTSLKCQGVGFSRLRAKNFNFD